MDELDAQIISLLRCNCRCPKTKTATRLSVSVSVLHKRIRALEMKRVVIKYCALVDYQKIGYYMHVFFAISANKKEELLNFLISHQNVNNLFRAGGGFDLLAECIFPDIKELHNFTEHLTRFKVCKIAEHHLIEPFKQEGFLSK
ncbi:MAG: Lrp/AsnC family transcriptional regulator [Candidatus Woesearchaeota archaeon]